MVMWSAIQSTSDFNEVTMLSVIQAGISIFGLFHMDPALFAFLLVTITFGALNILEFKRFD
ncbi:hypothetical protein [Fretibacter rubidus]|uniref:hypothetical protein n=1 Tax=Fretibacter rubidus TaxID=570162 RepID=UPI00352A8DC0